MTGVSSLPQLIMGPMVRRADPHQVCFQFVTTRNSDYRIEFEGLESTCQHEVIQLGEALFLHYVIVLPTSQPFGVDSLIYYSLHDRDKSLDLSAFCYERADFPAFVIPNRLDKILHGSCRNPHHPAKDSLVAADTWQNEQRQSLNAGADLLLLSGDQVYADDVAGPMLLAIEKIITLFGIFKEPPLKLNLPACFSEQLYSRHLYLPKVPWQNRSKWGVGYWLKKDEPHFSSLKAENHLVHFQEFIALYILNFSAVSWQLIDFAQADCPTLPPKHATQFQLEKDALLGFADGLNKTQRLFANVSTLMMFDDHDVTDDWNLTAGWEHAIYQHPVSRRIVNNGLISYWLMQGIGNDAGEKTLSLLSAFTKSFDGQTWQFKEFDKLILNFNYWHYELNTIPKVVVLDTRTHRWRNEQNFNEPSGLLDWERLTELEESLLSHDKVIIVSPAPVFGVKSIEAIQAMFNFCGQPLLVDVENWMAHEGSAKKLLDTFRREDTPKETLILSGDVHYSFCFSVQKRFGKHKNRIWQLTASGIKNEFPRKLINVLDKLDSILYAPKSPLNFFTKRWQMEVDKHQTKGDGQKYLVSNAAISLIELNDGLLAKYELIHADNQITEFDLNDH
ncbi:metallophosphatase [Pseudoalteromonas lipolytica]|uniref:Metallophosphatase n=1 Tax=Pseudoalteromonas lipolytica TaxID=570156 RepID=A0AAD0RZT6_9GAMM|nr:alkaline phosphatase D family protein [Pseudoalteromonas donghaensis]AXV65431.1 metallophosphatase [Pseudoalteromonas donghaensis]